MQHIITDEEVSVALVKFSELGEPLPSVYALKNAIKYVLNNRPQVAQLRPIAEMPEKPAEGCMRFYTSLGTYEEGQWAPLTLFQGVRDTHALDIQLPTPDPDAEERRQFEEAMKKLHPEFDVKVNTAGDYVINHVNNAWFGWKLAKKGGDK